jgi:hypothetical protein
VDDFHLHLHADPESQLPTLDPDRRNRLVSCVAALRHCVIGLAALGWHTSAPLLRSSCAWPLGGHEIVPRAPITESDIALLAAAQRRRTNRRRYSDQPVLAVTIGAICARLSHIGVTVREVRSLPRLRRIVALCVRQHRATMTISSN